MGIASLISDRHPVVSFQIIIQFTLGIDKGKDTELDIQLGKVLRNFNITIRWIIGRAAIRHMDLDAVDDRIRNYIVSDIVIQIQRQHIAGTGQINLLFIRIIVMTGINRQRRIQRIIIPCGMIGSHPFRLLNLGIQQIGYIHALNHLRRKHGKPVAVGHDFKQIYRIQLARVNFYYIFSLHEINMIAVADPHAVSFLIPFHGQDGAEVIAVLR